MCEPRNRDNGASTLTLISVQRSLRCHDAVKVQRSLAPLSRFWTVHSLLLCMHTNVVDFRVMRRLWHREWNWQSVNHIPRIHGPRDHGVWRLAFNSVYTCTVRAPVFGRHQYLLAPQSISEKLMEVYLSGWMNYNYTACCYVSYIQQYFNTSITVLTNQLLKVTDVLFKVPNAGAFTYFAMYQYTCTVSCMSHHTYRSIK